MVAYGAAEASPGMAQPANPANYEFKDEIDQQAELG